MHQTHCCQTLPYYSIFVPNGTGLSYIGGQEGQNAQNIVSSNSPTGKLSNDTPYAYSTAKNEITIFRAIRGL